jgi:hypothetical protein
MQQNYSNLNQKKILKFPSFFWVKKTPKKLKKIHQSHAFVELDINQRKKKKGNMKSEFPATYAGLSQNLLFTWQL